jgi:hypothetical protein
MELIPPARSRSEERRRVLRTTLLCLQFPPTEPELASLQRAFDSWKGLGMIADGLARQGLRLWLTHVGPREWRCTLMGDNPLLAHRGYGVAPTPWAAVQRAGWAALRGESAAV